LDKPGRAIRLVFVMRASVPHGESGGISCNVSVIRMPAASLPAIVYLTRGSRAEAAGEYGEDQRLEHSRARRIERAIHEDIDGGCLRAQSLFLFVIAAHGMHGGIGITN